MGRPYAATARRAVRVSAKRGGLSAIAPVFASNSVERETGDQVRTIRVLSRETFVPPVSYLPSVCRASVTRSRLAGLAVLGLQPNDPRLATAARCSACRG